MTDKLNVLIVGFGSIGRRHAKILKKQKFVKNVYIFSKLSNHNFNKIKRLDYENLKDIDYIIIANKTHEHFQTLNQINKIISKKIILVEKPLFSKNLKLNAIKNKIFVGYCMRFTPMFLFIKKNFFINKIKKISIVSHSNLKIWRKNIHYSRSASAAKVGGGVLFDYSHEIDLLTWVFGKLKKKFSYHKKLSNLKIKSKDFLFFFGKIKNAIINFEFNFFSKQNLRLITIDQNDTTYEIDLIKQKITKFNENSKKIINLKKISRNNMFLDMHKNILFSKNKFACSYLEGVKINKILKNLN